MTILVWTMISATGQDESPSSPAEAASSTRVMSAALRTMFSPLSTPQRKTMGLLQRNFMDMAGHSGQLQVAIVVDGTNSMTDELAGVRQSIHLMLDDLRRLRGDAIGVAVVIYRDSGSPLGEVEIALPTFSDEKAELDVAIERLQPQSGAPFFNELTDLGLHNAITKLPWSDDPAVTKWVLLFGDAPPYDVSFKDDSIPAARRRFADEVLVSQALRRDIQIHCVLCSSTEQTRQSYEESVGQTRRFMDRLASQTGGMVLDLSYPVIRDALSIRGNDPSFAYTSIEPIDQQDLKAAELKTHTDPLAIAVLPHEALETMTFQPDRTAYQVATALQRSLGQLPGLRVKNPLEVERQVRRMRAEGLSGAEAIRGLASRLRVDYVLWGKVQDQPAITTAAFRQRDGVRVISVSSDGTPDRQATFVLRVAARSDQPDDALTKFAARVLKSGNESLLLAKLADTPSTTKSLLTAMGALQQALGQTINSDASTQLLTQAHAAAESALKSEPANVLGNWLMANIAMNQASAAYRSGEVALASEAMKVSRSALRVAYDRREDLASDPLQIEIEADYRWLVRKDHDAAIQLYESMTDADLPADTRLRGHWMLAGIFAGDWGAPETLVDRAKARVHTVSILAEFPDSPEATMLKQWLQWDDATGRTRHPHLPRLNEALVKLGE